MYLHTQTQNNGVPGQEPIQSSTVWDSFKNYYKTVLNIVCNYLCYYNTFDMLDEFYTIK